ncbi:hypothetical protein HYT01_01700 [Candidatus Giovannonibacteria bacterium]|nr:hypothetical protein [Candidatus Giovannonibacteria bacterium]
MKYLKKIIILSLLSLTTLVASAQVVPDDAIVFNTTPQYPKPGENVTVSVNSYIFDISRAEFVWTVNSKKVAAGGGITSVNLKAGSAGSTAVVKVSASLNNEVYEGNTVIYVTDVDLVVNANTYAPNFYRGSKLITPGSTIDIFAVPFLYFDGTRLNPTTLSYEWTLNGTRMGNQSGKGRDKLSLDIADVNGYYDIELKVSSPQKTVIAAKRISFQTQAPKILFYKTDTLLGRKPVALQNLNEFAGNTFTIAAEPYFFDLRFVSKLLTRWSSNGQTINKKDSTKPFELELAAPPDTESLTPFNFEAQKPNSLFQQAEAFLNIHILRKSGNE